MPEMPVLENLDERIQTRVTNKEKAEFYRLCGNGRVVAQLMRWGFQQALQYARDHAEELASSEKAS